MSDTTRKPKKSLLRRILKWSGITLVLLLIVAIAMPFLFKDKIIEIAKNEINKNLNAKVTFGEFDLSLLSSFPDFRFSINDVKVVGLKEFEKDTLANIPALKFDLDLMSVIGGDKYKINSITLDKPRIQVKVLKDGKANYDIAKPSADTATAAPSEPTKFSLALKELEIKNGYIVYDDASLGVLTVMDNMNHTLSGDFTQDVFLMKTMTEMERFTVAYDGVSYLSKVNTKLKADLDMDMPNMKFTFKENEINLNELGFGIDGFFAMPGDDYNMDLKFKAKQSEFKSFLSLIPGAYTKDFAQVKTAGKLMFDGFLKGLYSEKQNKMPGYGVRLNIADAMFQYPGVPKSVNNIQVDVNVDDASGIPDQTKIDVNKFHVDFGGNPIDAMLHVTTPVSDANLNGWVKGKLNLASVRDVIPLEKGDELNGNIAADVKMSGRMSAIEQEKYEQFNATGTVDVTGMRYKTQSLAYDMNIDAMNMKFSPQFVELTRFDGKVGKSDMHADGRIDNFMKYLFKDSMLHGVLNFRSSSMDLNEFSGEEETAAQPAAAGESSDLSIIEVPSNLDFTLNSTITKLKYDDIVMDNVAGMVRIHNSMVDLQNLKMQLMGGSMVMGGNYSTVNPTVPKVNFNLDVTDFDIQQTVKTFNTVEKLTPIAKQTKGRVSTKLSFTSDLDSKMMPIDKTINGTGTLRTKQVEIESFEPLKKLDEALKMNKFKKVTLNDLNLVNYKIENGRVSVQPFDFKAGKANGKVGGSTGLDQTINYVMDISIPRAEFGAANSALNGLVSQATSKGIPVKLGDMVNVQALFGGTVTQPTVKTSLREAAGNMMDNLKDAAVDLVKQKADSLKNVGLDKARAEADKILADAQVKADALKSQLYTAADNAKKAAYTEADKVEKSFKNPLEKAAKKLAADKMREQADIANQKAKKEADEKAKAIMDDARKQADARLGK
ncbi:MAG: AsmA family protein [Bacteroidia bacterium]|jgi:hypothetical protein|nr:AsmA family protein [Bacteroidia bacterium]